MARTCCRPCPTQELALAPALRACPACGHPTVNADQEVQRRADRKVQRS